MKIEINSKEYDMNVTLRTCKTISTEMGKPYMQVTESLNQLDIDDLIKILHCGLSKRDTIPLADFEKEIMDSETIGVVELYKKVMKFIARLQRPSLSEETVDKELNAITTEEPAPAAPIEEVL